MTQSTLDVLDRLGLRWMLVQKWSGPTWTGREFIFEDDQFGDIGFFHEFIHWCVADEWQLPLPDFGLGCRTNSEGIFRSPEWTAPPIAQHGVRGYDRRSDSWSNEDRVVGKDGGAQEELACWGIGLYRFLAPELHDNIVQTMEDFGCWAPLANVWTSEASREIATLTYHELDVSRDEAFTVLEEYRTLGKQLYDDCPT